MQFYTGVSKIVNLLERVFPGEGDLKRDDFKTEKGETGRYKDVIYPG